jgi:hypothetical protein
MSSGKFKFEEKIGRITLKCEYPSNKLSIYMDDTLVVVNFYRISQENTLGRFSRMSEENILVFCMKLAEEAYPRTTWVVPTQRRKSIEFRNELITHFQEIVKQTAKFDSKYSLYLSMEQ